MGWQERDWARCKDKDCPRERKIDRAMEGAFPSPVRDDAAWEKNGDDERAASYASLVDLVDKVREQVAGFLTQYAPRNLNEAGQMTEILYRLVQTTAAARHIEDGFPADGGPKDGESQPSD